MSQTEQIALWSAFAARIELRFPFRAELAVTAASRHHTDQAQMTVRLHVLERDTREPITVDTRRACNQWTNDEDAIEMVFDLLDIALRHELHESVRFDGHLVRGLHITS